MRLSKTLTAATAALTLGGAVLASTAPADARPGFRGGPGFAGARFGGARVGAFRGGFAGPRFGYGRGYGRGYRYAGYGLGAGLALGALAATAYPYGAYGYGYAGYPYGSDCSWEPRQVVDQYGQTYVQNVEVCY